MYFIIIYILSLFSFGKKIYINDFFSKDACEILVEKVNKSNQKKLKKNTKKNM